VKCGCDPHVESCPECREELKVKSACDFGHTILQWAIYNRPELKGGELRQAIQTIIGPEADARLQDYLNRPL